MNILITSVGRRAYLVKYFKEALNGYGKIHAANSSSDSPAFLEADESVVTPLICDENYIEFLIDYCENNNIKIIISLFDVDLPVLSKHKDEFRMHGIEIIVSDVDVIEICNDKYKTYEFLNMHNLKSPKVYKTLEEGLKALNTRALNYPVIVKPRFGMGSIGVCIAENEDELVVFYNKTKRTIENTYLKYESLQNMEENVIIQEMIFGQEYGLDVINDLHGNYVNTIVKRKFEMRAGETDSAIIEDNQDLKEIGKKISGVLGHIANLDVDVFVKEQEIYVLEMNARFGGGYPFSHEAGVNLPLAIIKWINGEEVNDEILREEYGIMIKKDINLVRINKR